MKESFIFNVLLLRTLIFSVLIGLSLLPSGCHVIKTGGVVRNITTTAVVANEVQETTIENDNCTLRGDLPVYNSETREMYCKKGHK